MQKILIIIFDLFLFQNCILTIFPYFRLYDEIIAIIFYIFTFILVMLKKRNSYIITSKEKKSIVFFCIFIFIGFLGNIIFNIQNQSIGIFKDSFAICKFFFFYICFLILFNNVDKDKLLDKICRRSKIYIAIIFVFCIINLFINIGMNNDIRYGFRSYKFIYSHPTYLVFYMVVLICILIAKGKKTDKKYIYISMFIIIFTFRSKGFVFILSYFLIGFITKHFKKIKLRYLIIILILGILLVHSKINDYMQYGLTAARPALYIIGGKIALDYFPIGSGFCTFASSLSGIYYSPIYYKYWIYNVSGLTSLNWSYMSDTFWPYIYGQFGVIGFILFIIVLLNIYQSIKSRYSYSKDKLRAINLLIIYMLFASSAESIFIDITGQFAFLVMAVFLGKNGTKNIKT